MVRTIPKWVEIAIIVLICTAFFTLIIVRPHQSRASASGNLTGYAWSDTIGWISLRGTNPAYGLSVDNSGVVSGYAWSDNVGWISANDGTGGTPDDLAGCPSNPCRAKINGNQLTGWLKALSGGTAQSGGWDGFISLSGSGYGPVLGNGGSFSGYAWGSTVVGWVDFSNVSTSYAPCTPATAYICTGGGQTITASSTSAQCTHTQTNLTSCISPAFCSAGSASCLYPPVIFIESGGKTGHLEASPPIVPKGLPTMLFWNVDNVTSCTITGTDGENIPAGCSGNACSSGSDGATTLSINDQTSFTLSCTPVDPSGTFTPETVIVNITPVFQEF